MQIEGGQMEMGILAIVSSLIVDSEDISCLAIGEQFRKLSGEKYPLLRRSFQRQRNNEPLTGTPFALLCCSFG